MVRKNSEKSKIKKGKEEKYKEGKEFGELWRQGLGEIPRKRIEEAEKELKKEEKARKKKELGAERERVTEAFEKEAKSSLEEYISQNASGVLEKKKKELEEKIEEKRTLGGEKLPAGEVQRLTRDFYLKELGYLVQYKSQQGNWLARKFKDLLRLRATVLDREGNLVLDKSGEPVEFKTAWTPEGETSLINFLKQEFAGKIRKDSEKEGREKGLEEKPKEATLEDYFNQNLPGKLKKEEEKLRKAVEKRRKGKEGAGKKFRDEDEDFVAHDYYLKALGYTRETRAGAIFWSEKFVNKKGEYVVDEKTGKPVKVESLKRANEFLKEKLEEKIKAGLKKEWEKS